MNKEIDIILERLACARSVTVLTGAGVSRASGVPTFRGKEGLWKEYRAEELATPEAFANDPLLVWKWYNWRREVISKCEPNPAHRVLAAWSKRFQEFTLITQNVDGLHEKAGTQNVIRFHGSIWQVKCADNCKDSPQHWFDYTVPYPHLPPPCNYCDGIVRPGVVWFGEPIETVVIEKSLEAAVCDVFFSVGTSAVVHPAASLLERAKQAGAFTVEINLEPSPVTNIADLSLLGKCEEILPSLAQ